MPVPTHLAEGDYAKSFPADVDEFPTVIDEEHYIDAWLLNSAFNSILDVEEYILLHRDAIESPVGDDIIGEEGNPLIAIPAARYPAYKSALAWDSNLLAENIVSGETIFGVAGTFVSGGGAITQGAAVVAQVASWMYPSIPEQALDGFILTQATPTVSAS